MFFLILLLSLVFPKPAFASLNLQVNVAPINLIAGNSFPVSFIVENAGVGTTFHYKIYGGIGDDNYGIKTVNGSVYLPYTGGGYSWEDDFPFFVISENGTANISANAIIESSAPAGIYNLSIAINNGNTVTFPNLKTISVSAAPSCTYTYSQGSCTSSGTQTLTVTSSTPTGCVGTPLTSQSCTYTPPSCNYSYSSWGSCSSSNTQTRTVTSSTPTGCVGTPVLSQSCTYVAATPTTKPTATPTVDLNRYDGSNQTTITPVNEPITQTDDNEIVDDPTPTSPQILGETTEVTKTKRNYLPLIFIISGGILLLTPLIITKIKKQ